MDSQRPPSAGPVNARGATIPICRTSSAIAVILLGLSLARPLAAQPAAKTRAAALQRETVRIQGPLKGLKLGLRHIAMAPDSLATRRPVALILHGANIPVAGNPDFPFAGRSMMAALAEMGLDVWALDFYGYGESDRYPEMSEPPDRHAPLGLASDCADQVESVIAFLKQKHRVGRIMLIGDSRGALVAGIVATRRPEAISRLVLFGPVTRIVSGPPAAAIPAYDLVTPGQLWKRFTTWAEAAGKPDVLDSSLYPAWAAAFLRSDPTSGTRKPASVRVPNGRTADMAAIAGGQFPYDPGKIRAPTLIVMGEWDEVTTFAGAEWLLKSLRRAPLRRLVVIGRGSHTIQYETERTQLYRVIADFLKEPE